MALTLIKNAKELRLLRDGATKHPLPKYKHDIYPRVHHIDDIVEAIYTELDVLVTGVDGVGKDNYLAVWNDAVTPAAAKTLGSGVMVDNGAGITINESSGTIGQNAFFIQVQEAGAGLHVAYKSDVTTSTTENIGGVFQARDASNNVGAEGIAYTNPSEAQDALTTTNVGVNAFSASSLASAENKTMIGIRGHAKGDSTSPAYGAFFKAENAGAGGRWGVVIEDGAQAVGRYLLCDQANGAAKWRDLGHGLTEYAGDAAAGVGGLAAGAAYIDTTNTPEYYLAIKS